jgi:hypothetical protein
MDKVPNPAAVLDKQWAIDAERAIERIDGVLVRKRTQYGAPDIPWQDLAANEHHHAKQEQRDHRQRQTPDKEGENDGYSR